MTSISDLSLTERKQLLEQVKLASQVDEFADEWREIHQQISAEYEQLSGVFAGLSITYESLKESEHVGEATEAWLAQLYSKKAAAEKQLANLTERRRALATRLKAWQEQISRFD